MLINCIFSSNLNGNPNWFDAVLFNFFRYYINYKLMKKKVKQHAVSFKDGSLGQSEILAEFSRKLDDQACEAL